MGTVVAGNGVIASGDNGIEVSRGIGTLIAGNAVNGALGNGIAVEESLFTGIIGNAVRNIAQDGISLDLTAFSAIVGNDIENGGGAGISVTNSAFAFIAGNDISKFYDGMRLFYTAGVAAVGNDIQDVANDGIRVDYSLMTALAGNSIRSFGDDGIEIANSALVAVVFNDIDGMGAGNAGIRIGTNENGGGVTDTASGSTLVLIAANTVANNAVGLDATALNNGYLDIRGNSFLNNTTGLYAKSGAIDLSHQSNLFKGGSTAMIFDGGYYPSAGYTGLRLVGDTIGTTVFEGQTDYYIDLRNGAFFEPGTPTIIDGTLATYDGVSGGLMSAAQLLAIESKINDHDDDNTLGQIFAGYALFDDNQILRRYPANSYRSGRAAVLVTGLPRTGIGRDITPRPFFNVQDLANIAPAAGGDTAEALANMEPAAGEGTQSPIAKGACWNNIGSGGAVNLDLGEDASSILADQAACGG
ncbi:MAG TPA: hypothetical protein DIW20_01115 [Rhodospirillaceae bacterium]|nr:hypothetical protein [Rhodospirillaceae bacterium]